MNKKRQNKPGYLTVEAYAKTHIGWRGLPVTPSYIYKRVRQEEKEGIPAPFEWEYQDKQLWIKKQKT